MVSLRCSSLQNVSPPFVRPIKLDFRKLNLILVEKIEFDCHVSSSGPADPRPSQDGLPFKFCSPRSMSLDLGAEHVDGTMSRISPKCLCSFHWWCRGALGAMKSAEAAR